MPTGKYSSLVLVVLFTLACSISFALLLFASLTAFVKGINKSKCFNIFFFCLAVFIILTNNNINAFTFSTQFYPFIGVYGVALINLALAIVLSIWGVIVLIKLQMHFNRKSGGPNIYSKISILFLLEYSYFDSHSYFCGVF